MVEIFVKKWLGRKLIKAVKGWVMKGLRYYSREFGFVFWLIFP